MYFLVSESVESDDETILDPLNHVFEIGLDDIAHLLEHLCETMALFIIAVAIISTLQKVLRNLRRLKNHQIQASIRLEFGEALAMSLTFLLAADIVATAISPSWDSLGKLVVIAIVRTALNYFLALEVRELEDKNHNHQKVSGLEIDTIGDRLEANSQVVSRGGR